MSPSSPEGYRLLRDYVREDCGLSLSIAKLHVAETRLRDLLREEGLGDLGALVLRARAEQGQRLRKHIIAAMTTGETRWFRDEAPCRLIAEILLPVWEAQIAAGERERIRIWSAACATGQEPYSVAMVLLERAREGGVLRPEHLELVATDIDEAAVAVARQGLYAEFAMEQGLSLELRQRYFRREGRRWRLATAVRERVRVEAFNLQDDFAGLGPFDLVLMRNVAVFFTAAFRQELFARLRTLLVPDGLLLLGSTETLGMAATGWEQSALGPAVCYQVSADRTQPALESILAETAHSAQEL